MKLIGKLIKGTTIIKEAFVERDDEGKSYRDLLEECLIAVCKELDIGVPMWLKKNTGEFAAYHRTFFNKDQFVEKIKFDRFEIRVE